MPERKSENKYMAGRYKNAGHHPPKEDSCLHVNFCIQD